MKVAKNGSNGCTVNDQVLRLDSKNTRNAYGHAGAQKEKQKKTDRLHKDQQKVQECIFTL